MEVRQLSLANIAQYALDNSLNSSFRPAVSMRAAAVHDVNICIQGFADCTVLCRWRDVERLAMHTVACSCNDCTLSCL